MRMLGIRINRYKVDAQYTVLIKMAGNTKNDIRYVSRAA